MSVDLEFKKVSPIALVIKFPSSRSREFLGKVARAISDVEGVAYATEAHNDNDLRWNVFLKPNSDRKHIIKSLRSTVVAVADELGVE